MNRRPWVLFLPILLDLFLWRGPQVSFSSLVNQAVTPREGLPGATVQALGDARSQIIDWADTFNVFQLLASPLIPMPSVGGLVPARGGLVQFEGWAEALGVTLGVLLIGMLASSVYYSLLAAHVRGESGLGLSARQVARAWVRVLGYLGLLLVVVLALVLPLGFLVASFAFIRPELGVFGLTLVFVALFWLQLYVAFAPGAIFVSDLGPLRAVKASVAVVRGHLWTALWLLLLTIVIELGLRQVWAQMVGSPVGTVLGIVGNAYIGTGLVAAFLTFYHERSAPSGQPVTAGSRRTT